MAMQTVKIMEDCFGAGVLLPLGEIMLPPQFIRISGNPVGVRAVCAADEQYLHFTISWT